MTDSRRRKLLIVMEDSRFQAVGFHQTQTADVNST